MFKRFLSMCLVVFYFVSCSEKSLKQEITLSPEPFVKEFSLEEIILQAAETTKTPFYILYGIAGTESFFNSKAIGDDGISLGIFQINENFRESRIKLIGCEYNPFDVFDSAILAGLIYQQNLKAFNGNETLAIASYRQGITGVRKNGATLWYVGKVLSFKTEANKICELLNGVSK